LLKEKVQYGLPCTNLFRSTPFDFANIMSFFTRQASYLYEEVNRTGPSPSVSVPCMHSSPCIKLKSRPRFCPVSQSLSYKVSFTFSEVCNVNTRVAMTVAILVTSLGDATQIGSFLCLTLTPKIVPIQCHCCSHFRGNFVVGGKQPY